VLNSRFGLPEGLARAFGREKSAVCHAGSKCLILAGASPRMFPALAGTLQGMFINWQFQRSQFEWRR